MIVYFVTIAMLAAVAMAGSILYVSHKEDERERELNAQLTKRQMDAIDRRYIDAAIAAHVKHMDTFCEMARERGIYIHYSLDAFERDMMENLKK